MLESLVRNIGRKITKVIFAGSLLLSSGCTMYKTTSLDLIQPVRPIEEPIKEPIDYGKLTWQEAIKSVQTPEQAQDYLETNFQYDNHEKGFAIPGLFSIGGKGETFKHNHARRKGICFDYSTVSAALLSDNGYDPLILKLRDGLFYGHSVFLYKRESGFGALGNTPLPPEYSSVNDLARALNEEYGTHFKKYNLTNLDENIPNKKWIDGNIDLRLGFDEIFGDFIDIK